MKREYFVAEISKKIFSRKCDLFVGSGISSESNVPSWCELLRPLAKNIGIEINNNDDLPMIAQYIVNSNSGNKNVIYNLIVDKYGKKYPLNRYHNAIAGFGINTVWTTNYDLLLEDCFDPRNPRKIRRDNDLSKPSYTNDIEIIKIHGSADGDMDDVVLTKQEYDEVLFNKPVIAQRLRDSFIQRSFLFIGYGYRDPDIRRLMIEAAKQSSQSSQDHYIILTKPTQGSKETKTAFEQRRKRFDLWVKELNRIGIRELVVKDYDELEDVLKEIAVKSRGKSIYVSGSHSSSEPLLEEYGKKIADLNNVIMINGQNQGVGINVVNGFMEEALFKRRELRESIRFFPNPYAANPSFSNDRSLLPDLRRERTPLFLSAKLFVVFDGGMGTEAEIEVAKEKNCYILPAVTKKDDYEDTSLIHRLINDKACKRSLEKAPDYNEIIKAERVPTLEELVKATKDLLNA